METQFHLGENIYKNRVAKSMSQTDLANELNVSRQSVSKWENDAATPDLDKLINMSHLFNVTLDELVYGAPPAPQQSDTKPVNTFPSISTRMAVGIVMLSFGLIFFLLSIFWGKHLYFGEEIGELISMVITLIGISMLAIYNVRVWAACALLYVVYTVICFGFLHVNSIPNYVFVFVTSLVILVWFIIWGQHASNCETTAK